MRVSLVLSLLLVVQRVYAAALSYADIEGVTLLTGDMEQLQKDVKKPQQLYMVQLYKSNANARKLSKEFLQAAHALKGHAKVGVVDCGSKANKAFCKSSGFSADPILVAYKGVDSQAVYDGDLKNKAIVAWVKAQITEDDIDIPKLTKKTFKQWMSDNEKVPKGIYFTAKKQTMALWKSMAFQFKGRMAFAEVHRGERAVTRFFNTKDFPSIGILPVTESYGDDDDDDDDDGVEPLLYDGKVNAAALQAWLDGHALESEDDEEEEEAIVDLEQLTDDSCMDAFCGQTGLCAILILSVNPEASKKERKEMRLHLSLWKQIQSLQQDSLYSFVWMDGIEQMDFLDQAFRMTPLDYPQVVIFSGARKRFVSFIGSFSKDAVGGFLGSVAKGSVKTLPIESANVPSLNGDTKRCEDMRAKKKVPVQEEKAEFKERVGADGQSTVEITKRNRGHRGKKGLAKLTSKNVAEKLETSMGFWLVAFSHGADKCPECKQLKKEWKKAGEELNNYVKFGWVNCDLSESEELCEDQEVDTFPTIKVFAQGPKEDVTPRLYTGELTHEALSAYALGLIRSGVDRVQRVKAVQQYLQGGNPLAPKFLLMAEEEDEIPDVYRALSLEYQLGSDKDLHFGVIGGKYATQAQKDLGFEQPLPFLAIIQGKMKEGESPDAAGKMGVNFQVQGMPAQGIRFEQVVVTLDEAATLWTYQKHMLAKKGFQAQGVPAEPESRDAHDEL